MADQRRFPLQQALLDGLVQTLARDGHGDLLALGEHLGCDRPVRGDPGNLGRPAEDLLRNIRCAFDFFTLSFFLFPFPMDANLKIFV